MNAPVLPLRCCSFLLLLVVMLWTNLVRSWTLPFVSNTYQRGFPKAAAARISTRTTTTSRWVTSSAVAVEDDHEQKKKTTGFPKVLLKRNRLSKAFRDGSQLVFSGSIAKTPQGLQMADLVQLEVPISKDSSQDSANEKTQLVGWGVYNPESMYRVRILQHTLLDPGMQGKGLQADSKDTSAFLKEILTKHFQQALQTRQGLGLPSPDTDTYRLVNGEGDGCSGLAVDIIAEEMAVIMSSAAWCEVHKDVILESLQFILPDHELIWKTTPSRLKQDGYEVMIDKEENHPKEIDEVEPTIGIENGIKYQVFPHKKGQKTSVYCDQRENRWNLAQRCHGKRVLDLCCYHGGFSLNAAKQGATSVVGVDSSQDAIDTCEINAQMNDLHETIDYVKSDISAYMKSCNQQFDVIVLDPPKLAPSVSSLDRASRKYHSLNRDALKLIDDKGGLFMTCTCSAAMTQKDGGKFFIQMVQQASLAARREISLLKVSGAAPCHTQSAIGFPAENYLTAALFYVHAKA